MTTGKPQRLSIALLAAVLTIAVAGPAAAGPAPHRAATVDPPGGASPVGAPVLVTHAGGGVDQLQLFTGYGIYPNTPGANLWYLPQDGTQWTEVLCCIPVDVAPIVLAAESADSRIEAFVAARGGINYTPEFVQASQASPGGSTWQLHGFGGILKSGFGGVPQLFKGGDGRLHFFAYDANWWQIAHTGQTNPGGAWDAWQPLGAGPFAMPVTMLGATVAESPDCTLDLTGPMIGAPTPGCTATTHLPPGQSTWTGWQVDPTAPPSCPRQP